MKKKKLGIYGGTFGPIHNGHIASALAFYDAMELDELIIMPTFIPPHKASSGGDDPEDRLAMARLAFLGEKRNITVCDYEIKEGGKSYTYLTLKHFSGEDRELIFLCGTDMFLSLPQWKYPDIIFSLAKIALVRREISTPELEKRIADAKELYIREYGARLADIKARPVEVSSSLIRELIASGEDISAFVPDRVAHYIKENRLYSGGGDIMIREEIRKRLPELVGEKRTPHVLGTEGMCLELADIFGLTKKDRDDLALAALLHDITKHYTRDEHIAFAKERGIELPEDNITSEKTLHQITGAYLARELYPEYVNDTVFSAILCHTTGRVGMTLTEKLMYLSDYIERGRTFPDCVKVREKFFEGLEKNGKEGALYDALILSYDLTVCDLLDGGYIIHPMTVDARNGLIKEKINHDRKEKR